MKWSASKMRFSFAIAACVFFYIACNKNIDAGANKAYLAVTNISPDVQPFDVFLEGEKLNTSAVVYDSTTGVDGNPYLVAIAGIHNFKLSYDTHAYVDGNIAMQRDHYYSLFAYDSVTTNSNSLTTLILQDVLNTPNDTLSSIRFLNFTDTTVYVTMTNAEDTTVLLVRNIVSNSSPGSINFSTVKAGDYHLVITKDTINFDLDSISAAGTKIYTVYIKGSTVSTDPAPLSKGIIRLN